MTQRAALASRPWLLGVAAVIGVLCVGAVAAARSPAASRPAPGTIVFSVGGSPVFDGREGCRGLFAVEADGRSLRRLVAPDPARDETQLYPSLTRDGRLLAFSLFEGNFGAVAALFRLRGVDGDVRRLGRVRASPAFFRFPWSPRAPLLLVPRQRGTSIGIERLDARDGRRTALTAGRVDVWPAWSPDGATIAFTRRYDAWLMAADGTHQRRLFANGGDPVWSPDCHLLAVVRPSAFRQPDERTSLWIVRRDGRHARRLPGNVQYGLPASVIWSPAGDRLLVLRKPRARSFPGRESGAADAYSVDLASGRSRLFARHVIPVGWHPDGVLYLRGRYVRGETVFEIRVARADGSGDRLVGVTDEEDVKIGSYPVRQANAARLTPAVGAFAPPPAQDACVQRLAQLVRDLG